MALSPRIKDIMINYTADNPGTQTNIMRLLMQGRLSGTGNMVIYPVDQGFEHGPARSFAINPAAYDPCYHVELAIEAGLTAFAGPLGMIELCASKYAGQIPLILKMNSSNALMGHSALDVDQAITASVQDALRLGCVGVGFTIYPGSNNAYNLFEEIQAITTQAKACGLAVIIWSYPRGNMSTPGETAVDVIGYGAHMACLLGAHIVKVKLPSEFLEMKAAKIEYENNAVSIATLEDRVRHIRECCFNGKRLVIFSGGISKSIDEIYDEARAIRNAHGNGHIIGRNVFRRERAQALDLLNNLIKIYLGEL